ncbi:MAG: hypothetical protein ACKVJU_04990 [Verrucomicrobiales bacterium]
MFKKFLNPAKACPRHNSRIILLRAETMNHPLREGMQCLCSPKLHLSNQWLP